MLSSLAVVRPMLQQVRLQRGKERKPFSLSGRVRREACSISAFILDSDSTATRRS